MRSFVLAGAAALAAAAPAPGVDLDIGAIQAATSIATGPPMPTAASIIPSSQLSVYNSGAASASASLAASVVTSAAATVSESVKARGVGGYATSAASPVTSKVASVTNQISYASVPSTCSPISWSNTFAFTTQTDCASGPYETGTYCGFINPEDPCAPQPAGSGPIPVVDTEDGFKTDSALNQLAQKAQTPKGWNITFRDLNAAVNANSYLGYLNLKSYDVQACADACNKTDLCSAFNIYIERDPAWNPDQCSCDNPTSISNFKCSLWGSGVESTAATNVGQPRNSKFNIVITGSNGYKKLNNTPPVPNNWNKPQKCGGMHDHSSTCINKAFFPGPFNTRLCSTFAEAQNAKNKGSGSLLQFFLKMLGFNPSKAVFINAAYLTYNGVGSGTWCGIYAQQYPASAATFQPSSGGVALEDSWSFCSS